MHAVPKLVFTFKMVVFRRRSNFPSLYHQQYTIFTGKSHPEMVTLYISLLLIPLAAVLLFNIRKQKRSGKNSDVQEPSKGTIYERERNIGLNISPALLKLTIPEDETLVYGVVMDMDMGDGFMSLACYLTGAANLHFSSGSGIRGGGKNPMVGEAGVEFVTSAQEFLPATKSVVLVPQPEKGAIQFFLLTNKGKFMARELMSSIEDNSSVWLPLFEKYQLCL